MGRICQEIADRDDLIGVIAEAKRKGLLKNVNVQGVQAELQKVPFPIRIPVDIDAVMAMSGNAIVRKVAGPRIESVLLRTIRAAVAATEAG